MNEIKEKAQYNSEQPSLLFIIVVLTRTGCGLILNNWEAKKMPKSSRIRYYKFILRGNVEIRV